MRLNFLLMPFLKRKVRETEGQTEVEYGLGCLPIVVFGLLLLAFI